MKELKDHLVAEGFDCRATDMYVKIQIARNTQLFVYMENNLYTVGARTPTPNLDVKGVIDEVRRRSKLVRS
jgi:hypothetical protein